MKMNRLLLPAFSFLLLAGFISGSVASAQQLSQSRKAELTVLVRQDCGSCHGMTLKGGLGKPLLPHNIAVFDVDELAELILEGVPGTPMPPWKELLTRQEANWIASKLKKGFNQ